MILIFCFIFLLLSLKERKRRAKLIYAGDDHREVRSDFDGRKQHLPPDQSTKSGKKKGGKKGILADQDPLVDDNYEPTGTPNGLLTPLGGDHGLNSRLGSAQSNSSALQSSKAKSSQKSQQSQQSSRPTSKQVDRPPFNPFPFPPRRRPISHPLIILLYSTPIIFFMIILIHFLRAFLHHFFIPESCRQRRLGLSSSW